MIDCIRYQMTDVPPGCFEMGGRDDDKFATTVEFPRRKMEVTEGFRMLRSPVTVAQWMEVVCSAPEENYDTECPVVGVSFSDVLDFCERVGGGCRLPSEAEWEYSCRAGSDTIFPHGSDLLPEDANYLYDELGRGIGKGGLMPVGSHGRNAFGLSDMIGNVCEWVADVWHSGYTDAPADTAPWVTGGKEGCRVIRGGGWDHLPRVLRASWRDWAPETARWDNLGFRVVTNVEGQR